MEEILKEARKRFPIGSKFYPICEDGTHYKQIYIQNVECYIFFSDYCGNWIIGSANIRNHKGQWAKLISNEIQYNIY